MSRVSEWEIERVWKWDNLRVTFEHWHENKSCSACPEWVNVRVWKCERVTFEHRHENKSCSACPNAFRVFKFSKFSSSQHLSDFQTFLWYRWYALLYFYLFKKSPSISSNILARLEHHSWVHLTSIISSQFCAWSFNVVTVIIPEKTSQNM